MTTATSNWITEQSATSNWITEQSPRKYTIFGKGRKYI